MTTIGAVIALSATQIKSTDVNAACGLVHRVDASNVADISKVHTTTIFCFDSEGGNNMHP
jgi:hypothetical protein